MINKITLGNGNGCGDWKERLRADVFSHGQTTRLVLTGSFPGCLRRAALEHRRAGASAIRARRVPSSSGPNSAAAWPAACATAGCRPRRAGRRVAIADSCRSGARHQQVFQQRHGAPAVPDAGHGSRQTPASRRGRRCGDTCLARCARPGQLPELVLENGSGLSRRERISAEGLGRLLQAAWKSAVMPELMASLPVTATDGTMKRRLKQNGVAGQAHIKTGSLEGVRSIAGYVLDKGGRRWIVVFFVNHANAAGAQAGAGCAAAMGVRAGREMKRIAAGRRLRLHGAADRSHPCRRRLVARRTGATGLGRHCADRACCRCWPGSGGVTSRPLAATVRNARCHRTRAGLKRASSSRPTPVPAAGREPYDACCGPYHAGSQAPDAESLMRSRYSAYARGLEPYLLATWHASTRPGPGPGAAPRRNGWGWK
jgi:hypothetical protein